MAAADSAVAVVPAMMRALVTTGRFSLTKHSSGREDWPVPKPAIGQVLVKIHAGMLLGCVVACWCV